MRNIKPSAWNRTLFWEAKIARLLKQFSTFYGNGILFTVFRRVRRLSPFPTKLTHPTGSRYLMSRSKLIILTSGLQNCADPILS